MEFKINPASFSGIFPVPTAVVDENIRLASVVQLKVILYLLRHGGTNQVTVKDISDSLFLDTQDVADALLFWYERGIVIKDGDAPAPVVQSVSTKKEETKIEITPIKPKKEVQDIPISRPSHEQIAVRCKECEDISVLFREAQTALGKTIGYDGQSTLLMIHDSYGLPVEVLLMLVEYCVSVGKGSFTYIAKAAKTWSEKEIDSIEKADEQIHLLRRCDGLWKKLCEMTGISTPRPTASQSSYLAHWSNELKFDIEMIYLAYEEMADHTDKISFPYINKVLQSWYDLGLKTAQQVEQAKEERTSAKTAKTAAKKKSSGYEASYDIDEFNRRSDTAPLVYKKKKDDGEE